MTSRPKTLCGWALPVALALSASCARHHVDDAMPVLPARALVRAPETLAFDLREGKSRNYFFRRGPIAAHMVVTSGDRARLLVAFPAGDTASALWLDTPSAELALALAGGLTPVERPGGMRGVSALVDVAAPAARVRRAVLAGARVVNDYARDPAYALGEVAHHTTPGPPVRLRRTTLDGHHLEVELEPLEGATATVDAEGRVSLAASPGKNALRVRFTALSDDDPLTPIESDQLVTVPADPHELRALAFLSYREKLLAGSWHFLTAFGRDTLLAVRLLLPVLRPEVSEAALRSVFDRLTPDGQVFHEEDVGEYAVLHPRHAERRWQGPDGRLRADFYHRMVDEDFLLAPVAAAYLLDTPTGRERSAAFLARTTAEGVNYAAALRRNLDLVVRRATPFAESPRVGTLIAFREGVPEGNWRDSADCAEQEGYLCNEGLGRGRISLDVNAALVPAALEAAARLYESPPLSSSADAARARRLARAWGAAAGFFKVEVPEATAVARLRAYAAEQGLDPAPALASLHGPVTFSALALKPSGQPVAVMNTDDAFALVFTDPAPDALETIAATLTRPFPAGLMTPVGVVVADPALEPDPATRAFFTRRNYHGTVVWPWQQLMLAAGFDRQLARADLPPSTRDTLGRARERLWDTLRATGGVRSSELWTFAVDQGRYRIVPFGQGGDDLGEANAVQLWSTVSIALHAPSGRALEAPAAGGAR